MEVALFGITSINSVMLDLLLETASRCNIFVVTSRPEVKSLMEQHNIHCYLFQPEHVNVSDRDRAFADEFMPGMLGDIKFQNTDLDIWKVLSLDRFKFWYTYSTYKIAPFIEKLHFDRVYISLDLGDTLPWIIANEAFEREIDCVAVQTELIRKKEILDMSKYFTFNEYIVSSQEDNELLKKLCPDAKITVRETDGGKLVEFPERELVRKGLGISESDTVYGLFFDKRDEWQCRKWLSENAGKMNILVVPVDKRSSELVPDVLHQYLPYINIYPDGAILDVCEKVVSFRYDENYVEPFKDRLSIVDYLNLNKTTELLHD